MRSAFALATFGCSHNSCAGELTRSASSHFKPHPTGQVVVGGEGEDRLSSVELFPQPTSDACFVPDLPQDQPRAAHSLSLLSGGRLVVCGGADSNGTPLSSCLSWVAGNSNWTFLFNMRCLLTMHENCKQPSSTEYQDIGTTPGRRLLIPIPLFCLVEYHLNHIGIQHN